jgi:hypothetical protein
MKEKQKKGMKANIEEVKKDKEIKYNQERRKKREEGNDEPMLNQ